MLNHPRLMLLGSMALILAFCGALALLGPIHISITLAGAANTAGAAPLADITATAPPATPTATATPAPSATALPPTATPAPSTTALPPTDVPTSTPRPTLPPRRAVEPNPTITATPAPPVATPGQPDLVLEKRADQSEAMPGDVVVFTITARNAGAAAALDVVITDAVPESLEVIDLWSSSRDVVVEGQVVSAYPATLQPGETVTVRVSAQVRPSAPAGELRNTALVTTSTPGDEPGNNISTATLTIQPPAPAEAPPTRAQAGPPIPARMPETADAEPPRFLLLYGPWIGLATLLLLLGMAARMGLLRQRLVTVALGAPAATPAQTPTLAQQIDIDPADLERRWRAGEPIGVLAAELAARNPGANPLVLALAVQRLLQERLR